MRRGSILMLVLWIIAVLSVMVVSFAYEARLQTGVNVYVRERNRVNRLMDAGQALAEVVLTGYSEARDWSEDDDIEELLKDDRWIREKRALKSDSKCTIGPILLDPDNPGNGTIKVEIELVNAGERNAINVNDLYEGGDQNFRLRWEMIMRSHGVPEDFEVDTKDNGRQRLMDLLIASWNDWRDEDTVTTAIDGRELGAEESWYEELYEDDKVDDEDKRYPRNAAIPDIKEMSYIRGWRDAFGQAVLKGGCLNPDEKEEDRIYVRGIMDLFCTSGTAKLNANSCSVEQLLTIPGIAGADEDDDEDAQERADAIIAALKEPPEGRDDFDKSRTWWPYRDFYDMLERVRDYDSSVQIGNDASQYLVFVPDQNSVFKVKIIGESRGMFREVNAEAYVKDKKVRYIKWRED